MQFSKNSSVKRALTQLLHPEYYGKNFGFGLSVGAWMNGIRNTTARFNLLILYDRGEKLKVRLCCSLISPSESRFQVLLAEPKTSPIPASSVN